MVEYKEAQWIEEAMEGEGEGEGEGTEQLLLSEEEEEERRRRDFGGVSPSSLSTHSKCNVLMLCFVYMSIMFLLFVFLSLCFSPSSSNLSIYLSIYLSMWFVPCSSVLTPIDH